MNNQAQPQNQSVNEGNNEAVVKPSEKVVFTLEMRTEQHSELSKFVKDNRDRYNSMAQIARIAINEFLRKFKE